MQDQGSLFQQLVEDHHWASVAVDTRWWQRFPSSLFAFAVLGRGACGFHHATM